MRIAVMGRRGRRLFRRTSRAGGARRHVRRARPAPGRAARAGPHDRERPRQRDGAGRVGDRRPGVHRPVRHRDVLRQAVGRRVGGAANRAAARQGRRGHPVPERPRGSGASSMRVLGPDKSWAASRTSRPPFASPASSCTPAPWRGCVVGAYDGGSAQAAVAFRDACVGAGVEAELSADIRRALWEKFCFLSALSGATSLARQPLGVVRGDPDLRAAFEAAVREAWTRRPRARRAACRRLRRAADRDARRAARGNALVDAERSRWRATGSRRRGCPARSPRMAAESGLAAPVSATLYAARQALPAPAAGLISNTATAKEAPMRLHPDLAHQRDRADRAPVHLHLDPGRLVYRPR